MNDQESEQDVPSIGREEQRLLSKKRSGSELTDEEAAELNELVAQRGETPPSALLVDPGPPGQPSAESVPPAKKSRRRPLLIGVLGFIVAAGSVGFGVSQWLGGGSGADGWSTVRARGMSISLPSSFEVITDSGDFARGVGEVGQSVTDDLQNWVRQFPDFFGLAAFEPLPKRPDAGTGLLS